MLSEIRSFVMLDRIDKQSLIADIVLQDYRTARVFLKYNIDFDVDDGRTLQQACQWQQLDVDNIKRELETAIQTISISSMLPFRDWQLSFLTNYIVHIHHTYLKTALPEVLHLLQDCDNSCKWTYPHIQELIPVLERFTKDMLTHLIHEEEILFPYIRQVASAYQNKESYASLFIRTLSKPVEEVMRQEQKLITPVLARLRELTHHYAPPANACPSYRNLLYKLREVDYDLVMHTYLENNILFPKALAMEKELLLQ